MPELPEVENVAQALREVLTGRRLTELEVRFDGVLDQSPRKTRAALLQRPLEDVHRHGKYMILNFGTKAGGRGAADAHLMVHLRMTGQFLLDPEEPPDKHVHLVFGFEDEVVYYRDQRKFGRLTLVEDAARPAVIAHVGPDMLAVHFAEWRRRIAHRKAPIKALLLDQGIAAGLGNIYVDESLFLAGVHPLARPCDLDEETLREILRRAKHVLRLAINHGGTTFMNFRNFHGQPGNFRRKLRVYGRAGQACRDCGASLERLRVGGRSSVYCPVCQPMVNGPA